MNNYLEKLTPFIGILFDEPSLTPKRYYLIIFIKFLATRIEN